MMISNRLRSVVPSLRQKIVLLFILVPFVVTVGCGKPGLESAEAGSSDQSVEIDTNGAAVAAILDGREITTAEIDDYMKNTFMEELMSRPAAEIYETRNKSLQQMVQKQVLEEAAAEAGVEPQALFEQITSEIVPPTAEEISAWYSENQERLGGAKLEQVSSRIEDLLLNERRGKVWGDFMSAKLDALDLQIVFEPPRLELEATRLVRGSVDAPITIMSFSDYQCPYCIRSEPVLAEVLSRYPDQVRVVHRHFPLDSIHPFARPASEASMCADEQGKFWEYHDAIFGRSGKLDEGSFAEIGSELGLDGEALNVCITERRYAEFVQQDVEAGLAAGVTGTPAFFVNGVSLKGARNADQISQVVETELSRAEIR